MRHAEVAPAVAILGFGELGAVLAVALRDAGRPVPRAFSRPKSTPAESEAVRRWVESSGARAVATLQEALDGAGLVLVCVPGSASRAIAARASAALRPGALWVDLASASPEDKEAASRDIAAAGALYVDAAVLGAVAASGARVPILAAGSGAAGFAAAGAGFGLDITCIDAPAGAAARVKLLRSVYMKGRDALVAEMLLGARHHGLERFVAESIRGPGEEVRFPALADRVLSSLALHAGRRAEELGASASLLRASGIEAAATEGAERRLRLLGQLVLVERFRGAQLNDAAGVLDVLERAASR